MENTFFFNIEAQSNVISQCFAVINKIIKLNTKILQFLFLNDHSSYYYDAYLVQYYFKDNWKQEYNCEHVFYVMNKNEFKLVLSLFVLRKKNIYIDCELMIWCFEINLWTFIFKDVKNFEKTTNKSVTCIFFNLYSKWKQYTFKTLMLHLLFLLSMQNMRIFSLKLKWNICLLMRNTIMSLTLIINILYINLCTICQTKSFKFCKTIWITF